MDLGAVGVFCEIHCLGAGKCFLLSEIKENKYRKSGGVKKRTDSDCHYNITDLQAKKQGQDKAVVQGMSVAVLLSSFFDSVYVCVCA